ncbi:hypothetical protein BJD99_14350 [Rhodococcus sp. 1163]|uniref:hypothetical protein n=1 Tax=Rhodococcus sp. 1163 TaxID=1905289 RepID=UPI0009FF7982|nr:hypothetical protein [Rhodococcus sp. 1163]ORI17888.1 hypothetical protein BJD99_14350 [Rhodococcus sp. 1163]
MTNNNANPEDTGQISVAELLARNGQKSNLNSGGRRRRGVKGGISVAELTGEIPVVRDEPVSAEAPVVEPPRAAAPSPQPTPKPQFQQSSRRQQEPELLSGSTTAAADLLNQAHDENERRPYGSAATPRPVPVRSRQDTVSRQEAVSRQDPVSRQEPVPRQEPVSRQETVAKPNQEAKPVERSSRTSGFVQRSRFSRTEADAVPKTDVVDKPSQARPRAADQPSTAAMPAQSRPQPSNPVAVAQKKAVEKKAPETEKKTAASPAAAPTPDAKPKFGRAFERRAASKPDDAVTEVTDAVVLEPVDKKVEAVDKKDEKDQIVAEDDLATEAADASKERSDKKNAAKQWLALAGQGAVAIVVGALLFKGFEKLWDMLPWVALTLAVIVIVGLVAVVRILRRTDDLLSMVIAIAVGVFVTLGPLAFQLSTG